MCPGFLQWAPTTWAEGVGPRGAHPLVGASSSTTWARKLTRPCCGRCLARSAQSWMWKWSEILTPISAKALALLQWQTTRKLPWRSTAWTGTAWGTKSCRSPSRPARGTNRGGGEAKTNNRCFCFCFLSVLSVFPSMPSFFMSVSNFSGCVGIHPQ